MTTTSPDGQATPDPGALDLAALKARCSRYLYGQCTTRGCLIRGGYSGTGPADASLAMCEERQIVLEIEALRERIRVEGLPCVCRFHSVESATRQGSRTGVLVDPDEPIQECDVHQAQREHMAALAGALEPFAKAGATIHPGVAAESIFYAGPNGENVTAGALRTAAQVLAATSARATERAKAVEKVVKAARQVCLEGMVAAPGPHFRWPDEYYVVFNKLDVALGKLDALGGGGP